MRGDKAEEGVGQMVMWRTGLVYVIYNTGGRHGSYTIVGGGDGSSYKGTPQMITYFLFCLKSLRATTTTDKSTEKRHYKNKRTGRFF
ncbi:unnamed protein product [Cercopithifilaria johnstoni]|uniref:Uncharacterized protein n=1 Tax=Cercopithifilaria johnstoni TaxID=2874296 RepID=A0A8J2MA15_9BILA|nr:unnamed protein product [Cercopithifilaria johnstoni]